MTPGSPVEVRRSPIHGEGLFALRDVTAGAALCEYRGDVVSKEESRRRSAALPDEAPVYLVARDEETDIDGDVPDNPAKYANHGCEPNAVLGEENGRLILRAAREISAGEEILFDYGFGLAESLARPCRCGSSRCIGRIVAAPLRPLLQKHLRTRRDR